MIVKTNIHVTMFFYLETSQNSTIEITSTSAWVKSKITIFIRHESIGTRSTIAHCRGKQKVISEDKNMVAFQMYKVCILYILEFIQI